MQKPTKKQVVEDMLIYSQVIDYIEEKYDIRSRDLLGKRSSKGVHLYVDFWHWFIDLSCNKGSLLPDGSVGFIPLSEKSAGHYSGWDDINETKKEAIMDFLDILRDEFGEYADEDDILQVWVTY